jgi:hypothetical protein
MFVVECSSTHGKLSKVNVVHLSIAFALELPLSLLGWSKSLNLIRLNPEAWQRFSYLVLGIDISTLRTILRPQPQQPSSSLCILISYGYSGDDTEASRYV